MTNKEHYRKKLRIQIIGMCLFGLCTVAPWFYYIAWLYYPEQFYTSGKSPLLSLIYASVVGLVFGTIGSLMHWDVVKYAKQRMDR